MSRCIACNSPILEDFDFSTEADLCHSCTVIVQITRRDKTPLEYPDKTVVHPREGVTPEKSVDY